jgi:hypothetical protein
MDKPVESPIYGLLAEFETSEALLRAANRTRLEGYRNLEAHSPAPVEGLAEAIGFPRNKLPYLVFAGGLSGAIGGFLLQWWTSTMSYPLIIGGKPLNSWPAFVPVTFECTVLAASLTAVVGMIFLNGLPRPYHPLFNVSAFDRASVDRFFLFVRHDDPKFDLIQTRIFLEQDHPVSVHEVPR